MRWALRLFGGFVAILVLAVLGLSGWLAFAPPEALRLASAYAAKTVCSNVFIAHRDVEAIRRDDLVALGYGLFKRMRIDVDAADRRVSVRYLGLFAKRHAQYVEGRGCTNITGGEFPPRPDAAPPAPATAHA